MFRTDDRKSICDLLLPPEGYRADAAVGTTYSLDFVALTAIVASLGDCALADTEEWSAPEIVRAVLGLKQRIVIFVNQGSIQPGRVAGTRRLSCLYDRLCVPVSMPRAAFHPKIWLVRYVPTRGGKHRARYRLICSSRNISSANTWECGVILDGVETRRVGTVGPSVARFLRTLMRRVPRGRHAVVRRLAQGVANVRFEGSGAGRVTFAFQHPGGRSLWDQVGSGGAKEAVLVAPFVTSGFLHSLRNRYEKLRVVSIQEELDLIADRRSAPSQEMGKWLTEDGNAFVVVSGAPEADRHMDLHAKLLLLRSGTSGRAVIGSANGTAAAWGTRGEVGRRNWEAVACLDGSEVLSEFERQFMYEDARRRELRGWVEPYRPRRITRDRQAQEQLDEVQRAFASVDLRVIWEASIRALLLRCQNVDRGLPYDASVFQARVAPFGIDQPEIALQEASPLFRGRMLTFKPAGVDHLSEFVLVELRLRARPACRKAFIVIAQVEGQGSGWREQRDAALLGKLVPAHELVSILLAIASGRRYSASNGGRRRQGELGNSHAAREAVASVLEPVLRAWSLDRGQFEDMRSLLRTIGEAVGGDDLKVFRNLVERLHQTGWRAPFRNPAR